ncbi:MAG TPA: hypothetical protein VEA59_07020 [Patescibacteria group bacterium]|nr:hypothetical protein [Patescibacteria group bacterium]
MIFSVIRYIFKSDLYAGVFFILLSYGGFLIPHEHKTVFTSLVIAGAFFLGAIFLSNYISLRLKRVSLLQVIVGRESEKIKFIVFCIFSGAFFEFLGSFVGGLWYYPYWSFGMYVLIGFLLGGWCFYILFLCVAYEAGKQVFDRLLPNQPYVRRYYSFETKVYQGLLAMGLVLVGVVVGAFVTNAIFLAQLDLAVNKFRPGALGWEYALLLGVGVMCICEFIEFKRHRTSFVKDLLHGYFSPLLSVLLVGLILAMSNEVQNLNVYLWKYGLFPWPNSVVAGIPVSAIVGWQIHILLFIELWRAFGSKKSALVFSRT